MTQTPTINLVTTSAQLNEVFKERSLKENFQTVSNTPEGEVIADKLVADDYVEFKERGKRKIYLKKDKDVGTLFENRVWNLMYNLGFKEMNGLKKFDLPFKHHGVGKPHQIDVFAKDDVSFVVAECKFRSKNESPTDLLDKHSSRRQEITDSVRKHYGDENLMPIFILATDGIEWTDRDRAHAADRGIEILDERALFYFEEIVGQLKGLVRTQFHGQYLAGKPITSLGDLKFDALADTYQGKPCYHFKINARILHQLTFVTHRKLSDPGVSTNYQRIMSKKRLEDVKGFVDRGGSFPTPILLGIRETDEHYCDFQRIGDSSLGTLTLPLVYRMLHIIDGQHRTFGSAASEKEDAELRVTLVLNLSEEEEIELFADINKEQKSVNASLLSDIQGVLNWNSVDPKAKLEAMSARFAQRIQEHPKSAYYTAKPVLTLAEITKGIYRSGLIGSVNAKTKRINDGFFTGADADETLDNATFFFNAYFDAIRSANYMLWTHNPLKDRHGLPQSNVFVNGHVHFVHAALKHAAKTDDKLGTKKWREQMATIKPYVDAYIDHIRDMSIETYLNEFSPKYGTGGGDHMKMKICLAVRRRLPEFTWPELEKWVVETSVDRVQPFLKRAETIAAATVQLVKSFIDDSYGPDFWSLDEDFAPENLLNVLKRRRKNGGPDASELLQDHLHFADINNFIVPERSVAKKLDFLKIATPYSAEQQHNNGWLITIGGLTSRKVEKVSDENIQVIEAVEASLSSYVDLNAFDAQVHAA
jgi:DGQHR domain-containing protein